MKYKVFWRNPGYKGFPYLDKDIECDYLIVGGGVTGVSLAYFLSKTKKKVVLIEKDTIAKGATGQAAGTLASHGEIDLSELIKEHGKNKAIKYWNANCDSIKAIKDIVKAEKIDCDFENLNEFFGGYKHKNKDDPLLEYQYQKEITGRATLLIGENIKKFLNTDIFHHVLLIKDQAISVNPLKFTQNLSKVASKKGAAIYEKTPLQSVDRKNSLVKTPNAKISYKTLIFATDIGNPSSEVKCLKSTIMVTSPLKKEELKKLKRTKENMLIWDSKDNYHYMKLTKDKRLLVGFGGIVVNKKKLKSNPHLPHYFQIKKFTTKMFPYINLKPEYVWSGHYGVTKGFYPLIEHKENVYSISGCGAQTVAVMSSKYLSDKLQGKKSQLDEFFKII